jgi:hypothetical protein
MVLKETNYYVVMFDFERELFKRKIFRQMCLDKELGRIDAHRRYGLTDNREHIANHALKSPYSM